MVNEQISQLQQELASTLRKAETNRRILKIAQILCYGGAAAYFIDILFFQGMMFSGHGASLVHDYEQNPNPTFWEANKMLFVIIPLFVLIMIGSIGLSYFYRKFIVAEQHSVQTIITKMFPDAKCYLEPGVISESLIHASHFFDGISKRSDIRGHSFGSIIFEQNGQKLNIQDMTVMGDPSGNRLAQTQVGGLAFIFKAMFGGLFAKRIENTMSSFRGLFAHTRLAKAVSASIVILPDRLERHLDYLAKSLQALKNTDVNKLVQLEDVEFECYFAAYASDEIMARYILTPAMMVRMTELRKKYGRDIMLSFNGDLFFFAVAMPEGFLTLGNTSVHSGQVVNDLYDNIVTVREILKELKLDKAPNTGIYTL